MKNLKPREIEVPDDDPFRNDVLGRKPTAEMLATLVRHVQTPYVVAIDSPWGTGKSTFIRMWRQHLKMEGVPCVLFNAWETDYVEDPFVPLVGELKGAMDGLNSEQKGRARARLDKATAAATDVLKRAIPVAARLATLGLIDLDHAVEGGLSEIAEKIAEQQLAEYEQSRRGMAEFRKRLEEFAGSLGENGPLVVVVDELDRCRPTFAVKLLERVKHLFGVPGVVFVFAIDRSQIVHTVRALYGSDFGADGYLRRFIDLTHRLPEPEPEKYPDHLLTTIGIKQYFEARRAPDTDRELRDLRRHALFLFRLAKFSLREQEQCLARILVALYTVPDGDVVYIPELATLAVLWERRPELYEQFARGEIDPADVADAVFNMDNHPPFNGADRTLLACTEAVLLASQPAGPRMEEYRRTADDDSKPGCERDHARNVIGALKWIAGEGRDSALSTTIERLSMTASFSSDWTERGDQ